MYLHALLERYLPRSDPIAHTRRWLSYYVDLFSLRGKGLLLVVARLMHPNRR
jgi:hypothetical protein